MTPLHPHNLHNYLFSTFLQAWRSKATSLLIAAWNLFPTLLVPRTALEMKLHFTSGYHPEGDGQTEMNKQELWNSTSKSIATTNKTIGLNSFH